MIIYKNRTEVFSSTEGIRSFELLEGNLQVDWNNAVKSGVNRELMRGVKPTGRNLYYRTNCCLLMFGFEQVQEVPNNKLTPCARSAGVLSLHDAMTYRGQFLQPSANCGFMYIRSCPQTPTVDFNSECAIFGRDTCEEDYSETNNDSGWNSTVEVYECGYIIWYIAVYCNDYGVVEMPIQQVTWYWQP